MVRTMNIKNLFARAKQIELLNGQISDLYDRIRNRTQLIVDQDHEITRLRRELKSQTDLAHALSERLQLAHEKQRDAETAAEYWQGKAANP